LVFRTNIGEKRAKLETECYSGNIKLAMSHVVPDLVQKILKGQYPLNILGDGNQVRHYTYAGDLADGIYECIVNPKALNNDFNVSTPVGHTVLELAKIIWNKINPDKEFKYESEKPFTYDVQKRIPDVTKSAEILNIKCNTSLEIALDEIIPWIKSQIEIGGI
jgi:nucleoside-diphosphate-sugar epimerase